jgi:hypothetical protein
MSLQKINPRTIILLLIICAASILRIMTAFTDHLVPISNFTPIGAMALFGGAYFTGKAKPFLFPLLSLFLSDVILSSTAYANFSSGLLYSGWYWTYGAFALMALAGKIIIKDVGVKSILLAVVVSTLIHWLISDIGGCLNEKSFDATLTRYLQRLITAIPYELNFILATSVYAALMFGSFQWIKQRHPSLKKA